MVRRLLVAVAGLALVAACGGGASDGGDDAEASPSAVATTTPELPRDYTVDELEAALPRSNQVPGGLKKVFSCPGRGSCKDGLASVQIDLDRPASGADAEALRADEFVPDYAYVAGTAAADDAAASTELETRRAELSKYDGEYDLPYKDLGDKTFTPGEQGTGTTGDVSIDGWSGAQVERTQSYVGSDRQPDGAPYQVTELMMTRGSVVLSVNVVMMAEPREVGASTALARQLATEYIQRLG